MTKIGKIMLPIFFLLVLTILFYSSMFGPSGYLSLISLKQQVTNLESELKSLERIEDDLIISNDLLDPETIDAGFVSDLMRSNLGWLNKDEILVLMPTIEERSGLHE